MITCKKYINATIKLLGVICSAECFYTDQEAHICYSPLLVD